MLRRNTPQKRTCHFCNTPIETPSGNDFQCSACGSWNLFDKNGRLRSDHPAMHDESLNTDSFLKRASPNKNRLPSTFASNVFCHSCQTNQTLIINMLSNYLPPSSDPSYHRLLAELPAYKASLYARYPPVCKRCQPAVDEQIGQRDGMARSSALGGWLEASNRRNNSPGLSSSIGPIGVGGLTVIAWNVRGALWIATLAWWIYTGVAASMVHPNPPPALLRLNIFLSLVSPLWQFWDPTWRALRRAHFQGREARVEGQGVWKRCQGVIWIVRLIVSVIISFGFTENSWPMFAALPLFEIMTNFFAFWHLRIIQPPRIRLVVSSRTSAPAPIPASEPPTGLPYDSMLDTGYPQQPTEVPALSSLSLSPFPASRATPAINPIFGVASLSQSLAQPRTFNFSGNQEPDAMDWTPTSSSAVEESTDWMRPPRFAPEKPTGLEGLLEKFGIGGDEGQNATASTPQGTRQEGAGAGRGVLIGCFMTVVAVAFAAGTLMQGPLGLNGLREIVNAHA